MADKLKINQKYFGYFNQKFYTLDAERAGCLKEFKIFLKLLKNNNIVVASPCKGEFVYGQLNILVKIIEIFSTKFQFYVDQFYELKEDLISSNVSLHLADALSSKQACYNFSQILYRLYKKYDAYYSVDLELKESQRLLNKTLGIEVTSQIDLDEWKIAIDFLYFFSEILYNLSNDKIANVFINSVEKKQITISDKDILNWCPYCFRRTRGTGSIEQLYCKVESLKDINEFLESMDTNIGLENIDELKNYFNKNSAVKNNVDDIVRILNNGLEVNKIKYSKKSLLVKHILNLLEYKPKKKLTCRIHNSTDDKTYRAAKNRADKLSVEDRDFIYQIHSERISYELQRPRYEIEFVTNQQWKNFGDSWINALKNLFPNEDLSQIINWNQFVAKFHLLFENYEETTTNPKWLMDIFVEAEIWLNLEKNNPKIDKRRNHK
ncbi:hypothetical protein PTT44_06995 [Acinetobacter sp. Gutcm_16]|uniref:hypothetical protein n=1 Tax=Acinetobacter sp. Gutcm_16 TaxID=3026087 RepID=UPI002361CE75|nr:hypothetical protein [Acinetobacter sp. Gutcm_16]MDD0802315.1 hypothetical protein [Acinetobacter sp. Gutcm_16]